MATPPSAREIEKYHARHRVPACARLQQRGERRFGLPVLFQKIAGSLRAERRTRQRSSSNREDAPPSFATHHECKRCRADRAMSRRREALKNRETRIRAGRKIVVLLHWGYKPRGPDPDYREAEARSRRRGTSHARRPPRESTIEIAGNERSAATCDSSSNSSKPALFSLRASSRACAVPRVHGVSSHTAGTSPHDATRGANRTQDTTGAAGSRCKKSSDFPQCSARAAVKKRAR